MRFGPAITRFSDGLAKIHGASEAFAFVDAGALKLAVEAMVACVGALEDEDTDDGGKEEEEDDDDDDGDDDEDRGGELAGALQ
mmetsp:Transcript_31787/g.64659  ORF Transcript_31787/g.64659 Transcript_31787/m.64659 type:complete len:83 (-) Transcript_31787:94-342(-)